MPTNQENNSTPTPTETKPKTKAVERLQRTNSLGDLIHMDHINQKLATVRQAQRDHQVWGNKKLGLYEEGFSLPLPDAYGSSGSMLNAGDIHHEYNIYYGDKSGQKPQTPESPTSVVPVDGKPSGRPILGMLAKAAIGAGLVASGAGIPYAVGSLLGGSDSPVAPVAEDAFRVILDKGE